VIGHDLTTVTRERDRRGLLVASAVGAVSLLAIGIAIGSRISSHPQPAVPPHAASRGTVHDDVPARPRPARSARTPDGAVAAATRSITAFDGSVLLDPARLNALVTGIASRSNRPQLLAAFAEASAQTRAKLGADTTPRPVIMLRTVPLGYRVERFSAANATVSVWYVGIVGSGATVEPQQSWRTQTVSLVWEHGAWKVTSFASVPGPTPPLSTSEPAASPGDLFSAIPRFEEFDRALP
jgi:hypothetical protein